MMYIVVRTDFPGLDDGWLYSINNDLTADLNVTIFVQRLVFDYTHYKYLSDINVSNVTSN